MKKSEGSEGTLDLTAGFGEPFHTTDVTFYQNWGGTRGNTLSGKIEIEPQRYRGISIEFPNNAPIGKHSVPQPWPAIYRLAYFTQEGSHTMPEYSTSGTLELLTHDAEKYHATGTFDFNAVVEGSSRNFKGKFDIRLILNK